VFRLCGRRTVRVRGSVTGPWASDLESFGEVAELRVAAARRPSG
jgi:hypothetical protein